MPRGLWDDNDDRASWGRPKSATRQDGLWDDDDDARSGRPFTDSETHERSAPIRGGRQAPPQPPSEADENEDDDSDDDSMEVTVIDASVVDTVSAFNTTTARGRPPQQYEQPYSETPSPPPPPPAPPPVPLPVATARPVLADPSLQHADAVAVPVTNTHVGEQSAPNDHDVEGLMQGWLLKRHTHERRMLGSQWAKRYFSINNSYGTLTYSKGLSKKASIMLPLCDITKVERLEIEEHGPFCFIVACPPATLTLKARDSPECEQWIRALVHHAAEWRSKQHGGR